MRVPRLDDSIASQAPSATVAASPAVNSARMIRLRRAVPLLPCMSIAASRLTFTPAWSHTGVNAPVQLVLRSRAGH
jgi:hypothetical protein